MKNLKKFTGRIYYFKNGKTIKRNDFIDVDAYNLGDFKNVVKIELYIDGVKTDTVYHD
jgi:hypothetical protein